MLFRDESRGKPEWVGVNASEHLSFARLGKASRGKPRRKPESTFRDRMGGLGKRGHGGKWTCLAIERARTARTVPPHLPLARPSSIPTTSSSARSPGRNSLGLLSRVQPQLGAL